MSTIADYSVFTKAFLASGMTDFSQLYGKKFQDDPTDTEAEGPLRAFAVIPFNLTTPLTPREAMNFDWSKLGLTSASGPASGSVSCMAHRVSCRDANGNFIGNIVRVQPSQREGSIRFVAKVAVPDLVPREDGTNPADAPYNTFVLVRTSACTSIDLPIAVATISKGYNLHRHKVVANVDDSFDDKFADPLDDVENANYVSFTLHNLNGYTSVDFNPDAYATYDVTDALRRRVDVLEGKEGIEGLHIAFNSNIGDIILSDSEGHVIDQANLHLDLSTDTIIAEGEEGYKYVKTDTNQNVHSAKAFMAPPPEKDGPYTSAFGSSEAVAYTTKHASVIRMKSNGGKECNGIRVRWTDGTNTEGANTEHNEIFRISWKVGDGNGGTEPTNKYLACISYQFSDNAWSQGESQWLYKASGDPIDQTNPESSKIVEGDTTFEGIEPVYSHDAFVHTVGNSSLADWDECFTLMGFHKGDDIPLGTDLPVLIQDMSSGKLVPEAYIHEEGYGNAGKIVNQRELAKAELKEYNKRRPALTEDHQQGTIIDYTGLDVRNGSITLGCGRIGKENAFQKVNYGIQMKDHSGDLPIPNRSESLDFTVSHHTGLVNFGTDGHATNLTSSTLLSIEAGSYISGSPTCLILAEVTRKPKDPSLQDGASDPLEGSPVFTPVRMTAGFRVVPSYSASNGLTLTIHDDRENITAILNPDGTDVAPSIVEVQAIYTHHNAETVPAQQMHTYIGSWGYGENHPECSFSCNKIEEWMTAVGLADTTPAEGVKLYVVIRVY